MCKCVGLHTHKRRDPTMTTVLRKQFEAELYRRFRRLKGLILEEIVKQDGFGLKTNRGEFDFPRSDRKIEAFMDWLRDMERREILGVASGIPLSRAAQQAWTSTYVRAAYQKGVAQAAGKIRQGGAEVDDRWVTAAFGRTIHADRLGLIYTRVYSQLEGITDAMDQQISRVLAQGLAEGLNPREIARSINNRIDKIGITRARTLARTEVIGAHAEATLSTFEEAGLDGVELVAEWVTAGDGRVCEECSALEGREYEINEARGMLPVHPNCRCTWVSVVKDVKGMVLR